MLRTYTRKAYLTRQAHANLDDFLNQARFLYNESLAERRDAWEEEKRSVTYLQQQAKLTKRREDPQWSQFSVKMQRSILRRLDRAYQSFFKRGGYPRFKSWRNGIHSFEDPTPAQVKSSGKHYAYTIKGIGRLRFRGALPKGEVKVVRVVRTPRRVKLQFAMEVAEPEVLDIRPPVGIDLGIKDRATLSNGYKVPKNVVERAELKRRQRILSRAEKGSNNREKKRRLLAKAWQRVTERERGQVHEITRALVKGHACRFVVEDLKIPNMVRNRRLSRSIVEQQWGYFVHGLTYKAASAGGWVVKVDPRNTTQRCSGCGAMPRDKLGLDQRMYHCYACGMVLDRDLNAAVNILHRGMTSDSAGIQAEMKGGVVRRPHGRRYIKPGSVGKDGPTS